MEGKVNLSPMARMYMGDVEDHANTVVESMEDLIDQSDALVVRGWGVGGGGGGGGAGAGWALGARWLRAWRRGGAAAHRTMA